MAMKFLDEYDGILPNLPRSYGRICCICGRDETYSRDGTPVWARYKDENGEWTGEWACHNCQGKRKGISKERRCRICGSTETRILSNGKSIWEKDLDVNQRWTGEYLCYECKYKNNRPSCEHKNRIYKVYDSNGTWTGRYICKICHR